MAGRVRGVKAIRRQLGAISRAMVDAASVELTELAEDVLSQSRARAPQKTGRMIRTAKISSRNGKTVLVRRIVYPEEYAPLQHNFAYNPGPVTRTKLGARWGIGRGFLRTPTLLMKPQLPIRIASVCRAAIRRVVR